MIAELRVGDLAPLFAAPDPALRREALRLLDEYAADPPMGFYIWLRWLTGEKLLNAHRQGLQLSLLDDHCMGLLGLKRLNVEDTSARLTNGVTRNVIARIDVGFGF